MDGLGSDLGFFIGVAIFISVLFYGFGAKEHRTICKEKAKTTIEFVECVKAR